MNPPLPYLIGCTTEAGVRDSICVIGCNCQPKREILRISKAASAQDLFPCFKDTIGVSHPFPYVTDHIIYLQWADVKWLGAYFICVIGQFERLSRVVPPGKQLRISTGPTAGCFPFRLAWQSLIHRFTISIRLIPLNSHDRMLVCSRRDRPLGHVLLKILVCNLVLVDPELRQRDTL